MFFKKKNFFLTLIISCSFLAYLLLPAFFKTAQVKAQSIGGSTFHVVPDTGTIVTGGDQALDLYVVPSGSGDVWAFSVKIKITSETAGVDVVRFNDNTDPLPAFTRDTSTLTDSSALTVAYDNFSTPNSIIISYFSSARIGSGQIFLGKINLKALHAGSFSMTVDTASADTFVLNHDADSYSNDNIAAIGTYTVGAAPTATTAPSYTISGQVFRDTNGNSLQDTGEANWTDASSLGAVSVILDGDNSTRKNINVAGSGRYNYSGLVPGSSHRIQLVPEDSTSTLGDSYDLKINNNGTPSSTSLSTDIPLTVNSNITLNLGLHPKTIATATPTTPVLPAEPTNVVATPGCSSRGTGGQASISLRWIEPDTGITSYDIALGSSTSPIATSIGTSTTITGSYFGPLTFKVRAVRSGVTSAYVAANTITQDDCTVALTPTATTAPTSISCSGYGVVGGTGVPGEGTFDGGPVFTVPSRGGNLPLMISSSPAVATLPAGAVTLPTTVIADPDSSTGSSPMRITNSLPAPAGVTLNIPANTTTGDVFYTFQATFSGGSFCPHIKIKVPPAAAPTPDPICPATISSTQARLQLIGSTVTPTASASGSWSTVANINIGDTVKVASFHNNQTTTFATDTILTVSGPQGKPTSQEVTLRNNDTFTAPFDGSYIITASVPNKTDSKCIGTAALTVGGPAAKFYAISEDSNEIDNLTVSSSLWRPFSGSSMKINFTFPGLVVGQTRTVYVRYKSNIDTLSTVSSASIKFIGPNPLFSNIKCEYSPAGNSTIVTIKGLNFGEQGDSSSVKIGNQEAQIQSWLISGDNTTPTAGGGSVPAATASPAVTIAATATPLPTTPLATATLPPARATITGGVLAVSSTAWQVVAKVDKLITEPTAVELKSSDGRKIVSPRGCSVQTTSLDFSVKQSCRLPGQFNSTAAVRIFDKSDISKPFYSANITVDKDGHPQNFTPKLQKGKEYILVVKEPKSVAKAVKFIADDGTNVLSELVLPLGDIAPLSSPDGVINAFDKAELIRQWTTTQDVVRSADLNGDSRVNSIDYSCLRTNYNQADEIPVTITLSSATSSSAGSSSSSGSSVTATSTPIPTIAPTTNITPTTTAVRSPTPT